MAKRIAFQIIIKKANRLPYMNKKKLVYTQNVENSMLYSNSKQKLVKGFVSETVCEKRRAAKKTGCSTDGLQQRRVATKTGCSKDRLRQRQAKKTGCDKDKGRNVTKRRCTKNMTWWCKQRAANVGVLKT